MGRVKIDIEKSSRGFEQLTLADINVVRYLIRFRDKVDIYYDNQNDNYYQHAGNIQELNQELIVLYVALDETIKKCNFTPEQESIIELIEMGYTFGNIASYLDGVTGEQIKRKFNAICKMIVNKNKEMWSLTTYFNYIKTEWKRCSKCRDKFPMNEKFFYKKSDNKDGFHNFCIKCMKS